jgi:hypothetical protein
MVGVIEYQETQDQLQTLQEQLLALELQNSLAAALVEETKGELIELDDLAAEFGFSREDFDVSPAPDDYDSMSPRHG